MPLLPTFLEEGSTTKIPRTKVGTLILTSLLEDLVQVLKGPFISGSWQLRQCTFDRSLAAYGSTFPACEFSQSGPPFGWYLKRKVPTTLGEPLPLDEQKETTQIVSFLFVAVFCSGSAGNPNHG